MIEMTGTSLQTYVVVYQPAEFSTAWEKTEVLDAASRLQRVRLVTDPDGHEARLFGGFTSGQTFLYDREGSAPFHRWHHVTARACGCEPRQHGRRRHRAFEGPGRDASRLRVRNRHRQGKRAETMTETTVTETDPAMEARAAEIRNESLFERRVRVDRMFVALFIIQWVAGIIGALTVSPVRLGGKGPHGPPSRVGGGRRRGGNHHPAHPPGDLPSRHDVDPPRHRRLADALLRAAHPSDRRPDRDALPRLRLAGVPGLLPRLDGAHHGHGHRGRPTTSCAASSGRSRSTAWPTPSGGASSSTLPGWPSRTSS